MKKLQYLTNNYITLESLKKHYKQLAMLNHPDITKRDTTAIMQVINSEYEHLFPIVQNIEIQAKKASATKNNKEYKASNETEASNDFINIINQLIKYKNVNIEIVGSWLWVDGATFTIKDLLHKLNFTWSKARKKWYLGELDGNKRYKRTAFEILRNKYGSQVFCNNSQDDMLPAH